MRTFVVFLVLAGPAFAQWTVAARAGMVTHTEGTVQVNGAEVAPGGFIGAGQTAEAVGGHAEILLVPGTVVWMQTGSRVRLDDSSILNAAATVTAGSILVEVRETQWIRTVSIRNGDRTQVLMRPGLFHFDAELRRVRVYSGELLWHERNKKVSSGWELDAGNAQRFRHEPDPSEFHLWASLRSFLTEKAEGTERSWKYKDPNQLWHAGFGVSYPAPTPKALARTNEAAEAQRKMGVFLNVDPTAEEQLTRLKYLTMQQAGLLYNSTDVVLLGEEGTPDGVPRPLFLGRDRLLRSSGNSEVFLGLGVTACLGEGSAIRILDTRPSAPLMKLEGGSAMIEVRDNDTHHVRVQVGNSITELRKAGVYEFNASQNMLWVHGGESETVSQRRGVLTKTGESRGLELAGRPTVFVSPQDADLFEWCGYQSYRLYQSKLIFMTDWEPSKDSFTRHKVFDKRGYLGGPSR